MKASAPARPLHPAAPLDEEFSHALFEQAAVGIVFADLEGVLIRVNRRLGDILGYAPEDLVGRRFRDILPAEEQKEYRLMAVDMSTGKRDSYTMERRLPRRDGTPVWVRLSVSPLHRAAGEVSGFIGLMEDISARKHQELLVRGVNQAALAMEKALTPEEVFAALRDGFGATGCSGWVLLAEGDGEHLREACSCCGQAGGEEDSRGAGPPAVSLASSGELARVFHGGETVFLEEAALFLAGLFPPDGGGSRCPGGAGGDQRCIVTPLHEEKGVAGVMIVRSRDLRAEDVAIVSALSHQLAAALQKTRLLETLELRVKELRRTQEQLLQSQKMEAVGRLAGGVAHDFKNMLTVIGVNTQMIEYRTGEDIHVASHVREIHEALERAARLIGQLLEFSRREASAPRMTDLGGLLQGLRGMLRHILGEGIDLCICASDDRWPVLVDPGQAEQAVINLAVNARDAMPGGGTLAIDLGNVTLAESPGAGCPPGDYLLLAVRDTGLGMSEEIRRRVFEPFFTTKERGHGTGLGLATVFAAVARAGGAIEVQSEPGFGTTFLLYFPRGRQATAPPEPPARRPPARQELLALATGGETILVVEDDEPIREISSRILAGCGYEVLTACCPAEALAVASRHSGDIHLLFTDLMMPGMNGFQLAEKLAASRPGTRVLITTGRPDMAEGMLPPGRWPEILPKPFTMAALARRVRETLDRAPSPPPAR